MFKEVYKQALDKQNPKDGLLEEILLKSKSETLHKVKPKYNFTKITSYAASVAAALVIAVCFSVYPQLTDIHKEHRNLDNAYEQKQDASQTVSENDTAKAEAEEKLLPSDNENKTAENKPSENVITETVLPDAAAVNESAVPQVVAEIVTESEAAESFNESEVLINDSFDSESDEGIASGGGGGGSAMARMMPTPASEASDDSSAAAYSGDVIFDSASAINEAAIYITDAYINASAYEQDGIWYVSFYTESEVITISLEACDGGLIEITRQNI